MTSEIIVLAGTAATLGFVHTVLGPDHYVPFIALSRSRQWTRSRTFFVTLICGIAHILSSVVIGAIGIAMGIALFKLEDVEALRGGLAAWLLLGFGLAYFIWGVHRAIKNKPHEHVHDHGDGESHAHVHSHIGCHTHVHIPVEDDLNSASPPDPGSHSNSGQHPDSHSAAQGSDKKSLTAWAMFIVFLFGPCEVLIPLLMYPAAEGHMAHVAIVVLIYGVVTLATMMTLVMGSVHGLSRVNASARSYQRFSHPIAGFAIFLCGFGMAVLGL